MAVLPLIPMWLDHGAQMPVGEQLRYTGIILVE